MVDAVLKETRKVGPELLMGFSQGWSQYALSGPEGLEGLGGLSQKVTMGSYVDGRIWRRLREMSTRESCC